MDWILSSSVDLNGADLILDNGTLTMGEYSISCGNLTVSPTFQILENSGSFIVSGSLFNGGGQYFNEVVLVNSCYVSSSNSYNHLHLGSGNIFVFEEHSTQAFNTLTASGTSGSLTSLSSSDTGSFFLEKVTDGKAQYDYLSLENSYAFPSMTFFAGANSEDVGGNTNWEFSTLEYLEGTFTDRETLEGEIPLETQSIPRLLQENALVISIPASVIGNHISPRSVSIQLPDFPTVFDNGEGSLYLESEDLLVGDVIYNQGMIIITNKALADYIVLEKENLVIGWESNLPVYTYNVYCSARDSELNYTYNRTALTGSYGEIKPELLEHWGEHLNPYITTVGLYNESHELLAVGKLNLPLLKPVNSDITFVIRIDI